MLKITKKVATCYRFGKQLRLALVAVSCMTASANGTLCLLFPGCIVLGNLI